jgi:hypothetical protein
MHYFELLVVAVILQSHNTSSRPIMFGSVYTQVNLKKQRKILAEKHPRMPFAMAMQYVNEG